ncbi:hypothetical protein PDJAM_G00118310 [Pangasius djambal]|uniref:Uncharacterized protein n=1 Tax=Pangasius djambal TaxID=1691987 RepID=A0ACC5Z960_9TELE|nr:hypothetical protein [Pangasius djambal]
MPSGPAAFLGFMALSVRLTSHSSTERVIELPLTNPELFQRVGIIPPKGCLLYGPPGTGKTLLARAVASQLDCNFLKVVSSSIVDKYIGESARLIREMFNYARDHQPCIIFMDEIDAIGGRRFSEGTSADREIQRTLMEVILTVSLLSVKEEQCCGASVMEMISVIELPLTNPELFQRVGIIPPKGCLLYGPPEYTYH